MKNLKEEIVRITNFEEAWNFLNSHANEIDKIEQLVKHKKENVYIDVCLIVTSIYFVLLPLIQLFFNETSKVTYAWLGALWGIPLILITIDIVSSRKERMAWDYLFLAVHDYRQNHPQESC